MPLFVFAVSARGNNEWLSNHRDVRWKRAISSLSLFSLSRQARATVVLIFFTVLNYALTAIYIPLGAIIINMVYAVCATLSRRSISSFSHRAHKRIVEKERRYLRAHARIFYSLKANLLCDNNAAAAARAKRKIAGPSTFWGSAQNRLTNGELWKRFVSQKYRTKCSSSVNIFLIWKNSIASWPGV